MNKLPQTTESPGAIARLLDEILQVARKLSTAWLSGQLAFLAALTILLSFATQGVILAKFGLSLQSDAFYAAIVVPQILIDISATALSSVLVPTLVGIPLEERQRLTWTYLHLVGGLLLGVYAVLHWLAPLWTNLLLPGFSLEAQLLTVALARVCLISMVFAGMSTILASYCRSQEQFVYPEFCTTLGTLAGLATLFIMATDYGIVAAAVSVVVRSSVELVLLLLLAGQYRLPQLYSQTVHSSFHRMKPILMSSCYLKTDMLLDRVLASLAPPGSLTVLAFTRQLFHAAGRLMNKAIAAPMLQRLSSKHKQNDVGGFWKTWRRCALAILLLSCLGLTVVVVFGDVALAHSLQDMAATAVDTQRIWLMFLALGGVLLCEPLVHIASNAFYASNDTKTPAKVSVLAFSFGVVLRLAGFAMFGVLGIGFGLSGYYTFYALSLLLALRLAVRNHGLVGKDEAQLTQEKHVLLIATGDNKMRVLCVIPGIEDQRKSMPFVRRQVDSLQVAGIETQSFYLRSRTSPIVLIQELRRFRKMLRKFDPHLVHAQFGTVTGLFTALATRRPAVMSCRGSDINPAPGVNRLRNRVGHFMSQLATLRMRRIICVSRQLQDRLWWRKSRSVVIPNGVDLRLFQPISQKVARGKLRWDPERPIVLFNARNDPVGKRQDLAEAVVEIAQRRYANIELCVLKGGVPPQEMPYYYCAADCLLMTSEHEGSPNVVKESLACGLPVISVDVGDVRERIRGVFPSFMVERDPHAMAKALIQILEKRARSNGRSLVLEIEESVVTQRVINAYHTALDHAA